LEWHQKEAGLPVDRFGYEVLFLTFELNRLLNNRHGDFQERCRGLNQLLMMDGTVTILGKFLQDMPHPSLRTNHRIPGNPELLSQRIGGLEANAIDVEGQAIGILPYPGNSLVAIGLVNPDSPCGPDAVGVQEDHNFPDDFLGFPRLDDSLVAFGANPIELSQPFRRLLNDIKHLRAKGPDEFFGEVWANAFDHPRTEIFLNAFEGAGWDDAECLRLEPQAMGPIVYPDTLPLNIFARVIIAAVPTTVTRSRCPRTLTRRTQKPSLHYGMSHARLRRSAVPSDAYWMRLVRKQP
jgi:hypothetical protein